MSMNDFSLKLLAMIACTLFCQGASAYYFAVDGIYYDKVYGQGSEYEVEVTDNNDYGAEKYEGDIVIPESVTYNGETYTVVGIGMSAFDGCTGLKSVAIPNSVTRIESSAFYGCTNLASMKMSNSVTYIGDNAFQHCSSLTSIELPSSIELMGDGVFYGCDGLTSVEIPNSVTSIGNSMFYSCDALTSVAIPSSVTSIGDYAFQLCKNLTDIDIPSSVTKIGDSAFYGCDGLTAIELPNSVTSIGYRAFYDCDGLTSFVIPNLVVDIGAEAFAACSNLAEIKVVDGNQNFMVKDECLYSRDVSTLYWCPVGKSAISIPNSVTKIKGSAFEECTGLTDIVIPNSVTEIGANAFRNCQGLANLTLGSSVTSIGMLAFYCCYGLKEVVCLMGTPVETDASFEDEVYESAVLYVPAGCKEKYETVAPWSNFLTIKEIDAAGVSGVTVDDGRIVTVEDGVINVNNAGGLAVSVYSADGTLVKSVKANDGNVEMAVPGSGMYIVKVGDKAVKVAM